VTRSLAGLGAVLIASTLVQDPEVNGKIFHPTTCFLNPVVLILIRLLILLWACARFIFAIDFSWDELSLESRSKNGRVLVVDGSCASVDTLPYKLHDAVCERFGGI